MIKNPKIQILKSPLMTPSLPGERNTGAPRPRKLLWLLLLLRVAGAAGLTVPAPRFPAGWDSVGLAPPSERLRVVFSLRQSREGRKENAQEKRASFSFSRQIVSHSCILNSSPGLRVPGRGARPCLPRYRIPGTTPSGVPGRMHSANISKGSCICCSSRFF